MKISMGKMFMFLTIVLAVRCAGRLGTCGIH